MTSDELRAAMMQLPEPVTDKLPPHWEYWKLELWRHVVNGDDPAKFWTWPCVFHPLLNDHWLHLMRVEFDILAHEMGDDFPDVTLIPPVNGVFDFVPGLNYSATLTHQLYHIHQWEKTTGKRIDKLSTIVEFGAGYGAMPLLVHRLGFKGTYYIMDLPEFQLLQQYYLSNTGEAVNVEWVKPGDDKPKKKSSLASIPDTLQPDLLIALYSLSEVDYAFRDVTLDNIKAKSHLFLFSNRFADFDNVAYFDGYTKRAGGNWRTWVIEHMPPQSLYSVEWTE